MAEEPAEFAVNFVYTEYSALKPCSVRLPGTTVVGELIPQAEVLIEQMFASAGLTRPPDSSVVIGMFSTLLPSAKDSSNTTIEELVSYGGHIIIELQVPTAPPSDAKTAFFVSRLALADAAVARASGLAADLDQARDDAANQACADAQVITVLNADVTALRSDLASRDKDLKAARVAAADAAHRADTDAAAYRSRIAAASASLDAANDTIASVTRSRDSLAADLARTTAAAADLRSAAAASDALAADLEARNAALLADLAAATARPPTSAAASQTLASSSSAAEARVLDLLAENTELRAATRSLKSRFAALHARLRADIASQVQLQVQAQQSFFVQHLQSQLLALQSSFHDTHAALRDELTSQLVDHVHAVDARAARIEAASSALSSEVSVLMDSLKTSQRQYNDLYSAISEEYDRSASEASTTADDVASTDGSSSAADPFLPHPLSDSSLIHSLSDSSLDIADALPLPPFT